MKIRIGIVDDQKLFMETLAETFSNLENFDVVVSALSGTALQAEVKRLTSPPDIMLIDVMMPTLDEGVATATWLYQHYPSIKLVALSMNDTEKAIIAMIKSGCCAYLLKDKNTGKHELEKALKEIVENGYYSGNLNYHKILMADKNSTLNIPEKEKQFLQLACSDMTYREIASKMYLSERTIDGYRDRLFEKFNVQSRVGLVLEAIRRELVKL